MLPVIESYVYYVERTVTPKNLLQGSMRSLDLSGALDDSACADALKLLLEPHCAVADIRQWPGRPTGRVITVTGDLIEPDARRIVQSFCDGVKGGKLAIVE
jgi:hypothetical protein